jgi:hypothetical protein
MSRYMLLLRVVARLTVPGARRISTNAAAPSAAFVIGRWHKGCYVPL